ncbi:hypothetical protein CkaCkLH20_00151 [Colletotrichum karsti]|uniref:Uncharacterized protein n=1 Tax=Colletotrichum karsti TaxID=1095194 RepID=A0A9P6IK10_9PEZI|nr:uncharacterized protein CkaCkLH20_00151 [Colletotrichum karsti]KAF9882115.1 hypothetical protein CkaCkLH20_00151 [Colletotrichum karsti]
MHLFTKILHAGVVFHVAFQAASSAILRGRSGDVDVAQLEPHLSTRALADQLVDLDNQLGQFLNTYSNSLKRPSQDTPGDVDSVDVVVVKRQSIQIPQQAVQDLLKLIKSIETQLSSILSEAAGSSPGGGAGQLPSNTAGNPAPGASSGPIAPSPVRSASLPASNPPIASPPAPNPPAVSNPVNPNPVNTPAASNPVKPNPVNSPAPNPPNVGPVVPSPFLTSPGSGPRDQLTTAFGTATTTGTRCKTTLTQTFTAYVYEDGSPAGAPVLARDAHSDDAEGSSPDGQGENPKEEPFEVEESLGGSQASTTTGDEEVDLDGDDSLNVLMARRESRRSPDRSIPLLDREADDAFEMMH